MAESVAWRRINSRCDNSGPNCGEIADLPDGGVLLRSSQRPEQVVELTASEWADVREAIMVGLV